MSSLLSRQRPLEQRHQPLVSLLHPLCAPHHLQLTAMSAQDWTSQLSAACCNSKTFSAHESLAGLVRHNCPNVAIGNTTRIQLWNQTNNFLQWTQETPFCATSDAT